MKNSLNNYYPYGSLIDAGSWSGSSYNFGYNGMLKEGIGKDIYHTLNRGLFTIVPVWMKTDPLEFQFPWRSPYISMGNNPINMIDPLGDADYYSQEGEHLGNDEVDDDKVYSIEGGIDKNRNVFQIDDFKEGGIYFENISKFNEDFDGVSEIKLEGCVDKISMEFNGEANSKNRKQADGTLSINQTLENGKIFTRYNIDAIGGPWGNGSPENGNYKVDNLLNRGKDGWYNKGMTRDGVGFSLNLEPEFDTYRTLLRIHPDGGQYKGTQGCIGLVADKNDLLEFRNIISNTLNKQNTIPLEIDILNNPNNNGKNSKTKSNGE